MGKARAKMPPSQRAKQFAPFDAVVGLRQALKEKEKIRVERKELSDDMISEINSTLKNLNVGDAVTVAYYNSAEREYVKISGRLEKISLQKQIIRIAAFDINFEDIYTITKFL